MYEKKNCVSIALKNVTIDLDDNIPLGVYVAWSRNGYIDYGDAMDIRYDPDMTHVSVNPAFFQYAAQKKSIVR